MEKFIHKLLTDDIIDKAFSYYFVNNYKKIGGFENYIFEFDNQNGEFILRISHSSHRTYEQIASELDFINYLSQNNANVSVPIKNINNNFLEKIICYDGSYFIIAAFEKAKGQRPTRELLNNELIISYGKTIGKFHQLTKDYKPSSNIEKRKSWDEDEFLINIKKYIKEDDYILYDKFLILKDKILQINKTTNNYGLIHSDVHFGNFFIENNNLCVFDFDDCSYQYFVSDIAIALFYYISVHHDDEIRLLRADNFMEYFMMGYLQENNLSKEDYLKIDLFLKLREFDLYFVIHRSCDLETDEWARKFVGYYRKRLINETKFVDIDFEKYYKLNE